MESKPTHICKATLKKDYRFSAKELARLGPPDKEVPNPHYGCAAPMKLWEKARVEAFLKENDPQYQARMDDATNRRQARESVDENRIAVILDYVENANIVFEAFPDNIKDEIGRKLRINPENISKRQIINELRHCHTNYHSLLNGLTLLEWPVYSIGPAGYAEERIKTRVNDAICVKIGSIPAHSVCQDVPRYGRNKMAS